MLREVLQEPGRYLVATPRINLINEQIAFLQATASELGLLMPDLRKVHGKQRRLGNVQRQLADAVRDLAGSSHAVVFVTHEALRQADLSAFAGWHGRIDEIPDTVRSGTFKAAAAVCKNAICSLIRSIRGVATR